MSRSAPKAVEAGPVEARSNEGCTATVLVAFHSRDGHTAQMARAVAEGAREVEGTEVWLRGVAEVDHPTLLAADGLILGSPVYNGNVTPEIQSFINEWPFEGRPLEGRVGGAFVSAGGISAGEEASLHALHRAMLIFGMVIVGGEDWRGAFGASAVVDEPPFSGSSEVDGRFLAKARGLGRRVAGYSQALRCGTAYSKR